MAKVITLSKRYLAGHPKAGQLTYFPEKVMAALADKWEDYRVPEAFTDWDWHKYYNARPKLHTIRQGKRWKTGDMCSLRVWSGEPYRSKQIAIAPDFALPRVADIEIIIGGEGTGYDDGVWFKIDDIVIAEECTWGLMANDGLSQEDFESWIKFPFSGQILFFTNAQTTY